MWLGAYDLDEPYQTGAISVSPNEILIHPDWNPSNTRYDADIAAITLEDEIHFTKFIRPICLSSTEKNAKEGYVTGWGKSDVKKTNHENIPKQIKISIHSNERCFLESKELIDVASLRTFCGGDRNKTGPCNGDSGGGVFVKMGNVFYLKGIVSASLVISNQCDVTNYAIYTNVDKFYDWIQNPTEQLTGAQSRPSYITNRPVITKSPEPEETCGLMSSDKGLIQGGNNASRELFPWTVATFLKQSQNKFVYFSTGTLISAWHVVSTGLSIATLNNISQRYIARSPDDFKLAFGFNNLNNLEISNGSLPLGAKIIERVSRVILHPNGYSGIANVGVLVLMNPVQFNKFISPACLPESTININLLEETNAVAVGWGQDDTGSNSKVKNFASVRLRKTSDCSSFWSGYLRKSNSSNFFCAGGDGQQSACYRDQALYLKVNGKWNLRGLISIVMNLPKGKCDLNKPVLYEDVGQYFIWLNSLIR